MPQNNHQSCSAHTVSQCRLAAPLDFEDRGRVFKFQLISFFGRFEIGVTLGDSEDGARLRAAVVVHNWSIATRIDLARSHAATRAIFSDRLIPATRAAHHRREAASRVRWPSEGRVQGRLSSAGKRTGVVAISQTVFTRTYNAN